MKFKVLVRRVTIGEVRYFEGETVETEMNLAKAWPTRFKLLKDVVVEEAVVEPVAVEKEAPVVTDALPLGRDVTSEFEYALEAGVKVWKKGHKYLVSNKDTPDVAVNEDEMTKSETVTFIEGL